MRRILVIAALCLCATSVFSQEPTPTTSPAQPATQDAKQAERERKEKAKQDAKAAKEAEEKAAQATGEKVAMSSSAEQELKQLTDQSITALKGKDTAALGRIWADDLIFTNPRGVVQTKAQRLADIQSGATRFDSLETTDLAMRVYGDTAVVNGLTTVKGQYSGQDASGQYRVTQVLVKRGGNWQIVALQMTPLATTPPAEKKP